MILQSIIMAFKSVISNKMRSILTVLGIVIGIVAVVLLIGVGQGSTQTITSSIESLGTNLLTVRVTGYRNSVTSLTMDQMDQLNGQAGIGQVAPYASQSGITVTSGSNSYDASANGGITLNGTTAAYEEIRNTHISAGRFIMQPDVDNRVTAAVIGTDIAMNLYGTLDVVGQSINIDGLNFTVVGVLQEMGTSSSGSQDDQIIIPFTTLQYIQGQKGITTFYVSADSAADVTLAQDTLNNFMLGLFHEDSSAFSILNQSQMLSSLSTATQTLTTMLGGIAGISLLVGGIGIMNIMLVSVSERTREIGIRKAIGAGRKDILTQFLIEALVISIIGGIIGLIVAYAGRSILQNALSTTILITPEVVLMAIGFCIVIGVIFGLYPANKASRLRPIEALHYEG